MSPKFILHISALLAACAFLPASSFAQLSFESHQVTQVTNGSVMAHADFNGDGREDLAVTQYSTTSGTASYELFLSNGNATYDAPKALPTRIDVVGDFNGDGKLDFASDITGGLLVYLGNGDGTFQSPKTVTTTSPSAVIAADMNHDGKTDLVVVNNGSTDTMQVWLSNGDGTFTKGQTISLPEQYFPGDSFVTGDFDGDGKPDVAIVYAGSNSAAVVHVWYGDGAGHLGSPYTITDPKGESLNGLATVGDINNDGRSDLMYAPEDLSPNGDNVYLPSLSFFIGNSNRTLTYSSLATSQCPAGMSVADFNGDGINDLSYNESICNDFSATNNFVVRPGTGSGKFGAEQNVYQGSQLINPYGAIRSTTGTKPDLVLTQQTSEFDSELVLLTNTSTGDFPSCGLSGFAEGVDVCTPGATSSSPVKFSVSAAGPTPMRTAAVWADGKKVAEQLTHAFSNYSFLDASVSLAAGSHAITVYGTGWDDTLQKKSFTLTVSNSGTCSAPGSPGVHICQPASGATVSTPVAIQATSTITGKFDRMEVWIDGVKKYTETSGTALNTSLSVAAGSHRFSVLAVNTAGTKWEQVVNATVK